MGATSKADKWRMSYKEHVRSPVTITSFFVVIPLPDVYTLDQVSGSEGIEIACGEISLLFFAVGILYLLLVFFAIQVW